MGLENADFISELVPNNPLNTDDPSEGAAHIRLTKKATQQSFPNVAGVCNASHTELDQLAGLVLRELSPTGMVGMWSTITPPNGWLACDGALIDPSHTALIALIGANVPDYQRVFFRGWGASNAPNTTQGENIGAHTHDTNMATGSGSTPLPSPINGVGSDPVTTINNPTGENRPANTAIMYIIKT